MAPGLKLIAHTRPVFSVGEETLTFTLPIDASGEQLVKRGDLLLACILSDVAEVGFAMPDGWESLDAIGATEAKLDVLVRAVEQDEPPLVAVELVGVTKERQGQLIVLRGGLLHTLREASASVAFAATMAPDAPASSSLQAINLALAVWSSSGATALSPGAGYTQLDAYSSALATSRSCLFALSTISKTGAFAPPAAAATVNATGRAFVEVLRDRLPHQPSTLDDPVPGNIGLFGKDTRRGR